MAMPTTGGQNSCRSLCGSKCHEDFTVWQHNHTIWSHYPQSPTVLHAKTATAYVNQQLPGIFVGRAHSITCMHQTAAKRAKFQRTSRVGKPTVSLYGNTFTAAPNSMLDSSVQKANVSQSRNVKAILRYLLCAL
jgi:hypothetical protein